MMSIIEITIVNIWVLQNAYVCHVFLSTIHKKTLPSGYRCPPHHSVSQSLEVDVIITVIYTNFNVGHFNGRATFDGNRCCFVGSHNTFNQYLRARTIGKSVIVPFYPRLYSCLSFAIIRMLPVVFWVAYFGMRCCCVGMCVEKE